LLGDGEQNPPIGRSKLTQQWR